MPALELALFLPNGHVAQIIGLQFSEQPTSVVVTLNRSDTGVGNHMSEPPHSGFALAYAKDKGSVRVYIAFAMGALFAAFWILRGSEIPLIFALLCFSTAYHFYPLVENGKPRIGAGEHGVFIEGFGILPWRSIQDISLSTYAIRSIEVNELQIKLARSLPAALSADWRKMPLHRLAMKVPWRMGSDNTIRINLEPFPGEPEEICAAFQRRRQFFGR